MTTRKRYPSRIAPRLALLIGPTLLPACAVEYGEKQMVEPDVSAGDDLFTTGSAEELQQAQDLAGDYLSNMLGALGLDSMDQLSVEAAHIDPLHMAHVRYQEHYEGVPIFGGEIIVHLNPDGSLRSLTNALITDISVNATPDLSAEEAVDYATYASIPYDQLTRDPVADLMVFRKRDTDHLVWRVQLARIDGTDDPTMPVLFVDAHTGVVVSEYDNLQTARGTAYYAGSVNIETTQKGSTYYLEDTTRKLGTYTYNNGWNNLSYETDSDDVWTASSQQVAVQAEYDAEVVWDFYKNKFGRYGIDGSGGPGAVGSVTGSGSVIASAVHYGRNYGNAFWDGQMMNYGDGDGYTLGPLVTMDISGHEMTHGVTQYTANLTYSGEAGCLDESMSDIMGASIEAYADGGVNSNTWKIGEDAYTPGTAGDALRYMDDPAADGQSLDYYTSYAGRTDPHYCMGIGNLAFYLLVEGGTHPRNKSNVVVSGIGIDEADQIFYRALAYYMTSSTTFAGARTATLSAAADLYGATSYEHDQVENAWAAVGVGSPATSAGSGSTSSGSSDTGSASGDAGSSGSGSTSSGSSGSCSGYDHTDTGYLSGPGDYGLAPNGTYYDAGASGTHTAALSGPAGADFDLYLLKYTSSGRWVAVAKSTSTSADESISYRGSAGYYIWEVYDYSGSGDWTLCSSHP